MVQRFTLRVSRPSLTQSRASSQPDGWSNPMRTSCRAAFSASSAEPAISTTEVSMSTTQPTHAENGPSTGTLSEPGTWALSKSWWARQSTATAPCATTSSKAAGLSCALVTVDPPGCAARFNGAMRA